jgi:hypothetical protein
MGTRGCSLVPCNLVLQLLKSTFQSSALMADFPELRAQSGTTTDSSSFDRRLHQREARRHNFQSSDAASVQPDKQDSNQDLDQDHETKLLNHPLLLCLRLLAHHNVPIFTISRGRKWNIREDLGRGSTFAVEQADLPVREAVSDLQYRDISKGRREGLFTDHTGVKWSYDTVVAYKSLDCRRDRDSVFPDLLKELRILCHSPLQRHPNIACFMGLAWIREEDMAPSSVNEESEVIESREWPVLISEKADLGTLGDFVRYRADCRKRISLLAKTRLLNDVLEAIFVSSF